MGNLCETGRISDTILDGQEVKGYGGDWGFTGNAGSVGYAAAVDHGVHKITPNHPRHRKSSDSNNSED
jgi:hypothetical protein